jgi:poly(A) polymerase
LSLELEKILKSSYSDRHFEVFFDYGLLTYFLPEMAKAWGSVPCRRALDLLYERNCRVDAGIYRDSISLALAAAALPFAADKLGCEAGAVWKKRDEKVKDILNEAVNKIFAPQNLMVKVREAAVRIMLMQSMLEQADEGDIPQLMRHKSYAHARELLLIRNLASQADIAELTEKFPQGHDPREFHLYAGSFQGKPKKNRKNFRKPFYKKRGKRPESPPDFNE